MDAITTAPSQITDDLIRQINTDLEEDIKDEQVLEGEVVDDLPPISPPPLSSFASETAEQELKARIQSGEWDNLDDLDAFKIRTPEGRLMARTEAIDFRIRQLEQRLPMLLNQHLHDAYIQVLKKIRALRKTKGAIFYYFYKNDGQRDLGGGK